MWGLTTVSYHHGKSDGHRYCESAGTSFLSLSRGHVIKRSHDFEGGVPPPKVTTLSSLVAIAITEGQI